MTNERQRTAVQSHKMFWYQAYYRVDEKDQGRKREREAASGKIALDPEYIVVDATHMKTLTTKESEETTGGEATCGGGRGSSLPERHQLRMILARRERSSSLCCVLKKKVQVCVSVF